MEETVLNAEPRDIIGKNVKYLRREGYVPAVVYGRRTNPISLKIQERQLHQALRETGGTRLITLKIAGDAEIRHVLARDVQRDTLNHSLQHVDLYEVVMTEKIKTEIPIILVGEALPVKKNEGLLLQGLSSIEIECLPGDLPPHIEVSLDGLLAIEQSILVRDLKVSDAIKVLSDPEEFIAKVIPLAKEEVVEAAPVAAVTPEVEVVGKKKPEAEAEETAAAEEKK